MDEFNQRNDNPAAPELPAENEFNVFPDNPQGMEFAKERETAKPKKQRGKGGGKGAGILSAFFTSIVAVAVIGVSAGVPAAGAKAEFLEVWATDTSIGYQIAVEESPKPLKIVAYNDFTRREFDLETGENVGFFLDLQPDMRYIVAIQGNFGFGAQTLSETEVKTDKLRPPLVTEWRGITHECTCNIDGYFRFTMDFIDENGIWSDFEATLTDEYGNAAACRFTADVHGEQQIDVIGNKLIGSAATFVVGCIANGEKTELYRAQVKI